MVFHFLSLGNYYGQGWCLTWIRQNRHLKSVKCVYDELCLDWNPEQNQPRVSQPHNAIWAHEWLCHGCSLYLGHRSVARSTVHFHWQYFFLCKSAACRALKSSWIAVFHCRGVHRLNLPSSHPPPPLYIHIHPPPHTPHPLKITVPVATPPPPP